MVGSEDENPEEKFQALEKYGIDLVKRESRENTICN